MQSLYLLTGRYLLTSNLQCILFSSLNKICGNPPSIFYFVFVSLPTSMEGAPKSCPDGLLKQKNPYLGGDSQCSLHTFHMENMTLVPFFTLMVFLRAYAQCFFLPLKEARRIGKAEVKSYGRK
jgi:hypothetical protein